MPPMMLKDLRRGDTLDGIFLIEGANFKQTRNGKHFIQMSLRDRSAAVRALRWESTRAEFRRVERAPFLRAQGRVEEFQGNLQVVIDDLEPLSAEDARVNPVDFLPHSRHDTGEMMAELDRIVGEITSSDVRTLVEAILARPGLRERLAQAPAGKVMHHAYIGGLLEHVISLAHLAQRTLDHFTWLDRSILIGGVVLHDLGKVDELTYLTGFGYSDEGQLVGHIVIAAGWIDEAAREHPEVDGETALQLKHLVLSHHGQLEFGSPKVPMTGEAIALHFLDNLDAKLAGFRQAYEDVSPDADGIRWGDHNHMLGCRPYFPRRMDRSEPPAPRKPSESVPPEKVDENPAPGSLPF